MKNKRKVTLTVVAIFTIVLTVLGVTYAYWTLTRKQSDTNDLVAACLDLDLTNDNDSKTGITLTDAWPMSDTKGLESSENEYKFVVTNHCSEDVYYEVILERYINENSLNSSSLVVALDNSKVGVLNSLENREPEDNTASEAKLIGGNKLAGNSTKTHSLKLWIDANAPVSEQGKSFIGKVFIIGGQGIEETEFRKVIASGDYSATENDMVTWTYYSDGELAFTGTGAMYNHYIGNETTDSFEEKNMFFQDLILYKVLTGQYNDKYNYDPDEIITKRMAWYEIRRDLSAEYLYYISDNIIEQESGFPTREAALSYFSEHPEVASTFGLSDAQYAIDLCNTIPQLKKITISEGITSICLSAFVSSLSNLTTITIPNSTKIIQDEAFAYSDDFTAITIPYGVEKIGESSFDHLHLTNVTIPGSVKSIGRWAFEGNYLEEVRLQDGLEIIGQDAFESNNLTSITIPTSVKLIEHGAFAYNNLTSLTILDGVKTIEAEAFAFNNLTSITIPASVETIGNGAFDNNNFSSASDITILGDSTRFDSVWTDIGFPAK